jgi:hypothetical protein
VLPFSISAFWVSGAPLFDQHLHELTMDDLLPIYGETFLRYVLAIDDPDDPIPQELSAHQREVASALRQVASQAPADPQRIGQYTHLSNLGRWQEESGSSIANALRVHAGGELPAVPDSANPLVDHLTKVARDIWPSMLLPLPTISPASFWHSTPIGVFVHPETIEAGKAFLRDTKLRKLFPGSPSGTAIDALNMSSLVEVNAYWTTNAGRGGTQGLMTLLGLLISNSHLRSIMRRGRSSWEALVAEIPNTVAEMKKLANSETVDVPRSIGFLGLTVPDEVVVTLPHGTLRGLRQGDRDYLLPESTSATCIFLTTFPLRLLEIETWNPTSQIDPLSQRSSGVWEVARADLQAAERKIDLTRLAVLLSSPEDKTWALAQISSLIADPTSPGGISQWSAQRYGVNYGELDDAAGGRIGAWWEILNEHHPTSLDIAMRRVLSAAGNRLGGVPSNGGL